MRQDTLRGRIIVLIVVAALALSATAGVLIAQGSNARFEVVADSGPLPLSATLLLDGTVFVAGSNGVRLYDPSARAFTVLSVPPNLRDVHRATLLENGTVLITGGRTQDSTALTFVTHTDVLIYNPASPRFTTVGPLSVPRNGHSTTLLPDGRVLILGGADQQGGFGDPHDTHASAEIYDPTTERFSPAGSLLVARQNHAATLLPDGTVAVAGGPNSEGTTRTVEIFDPGSGTSRAAAETSSTFSNPAMFQRLDGTLALVDGAVGAEIIDLETGIARVAVATDDLPRTVSGGTSVALQDGRVLIIGGRVLGPEGGASPPTSTGETILIDLEAGAAVAGPTLNTPRFAHVSVTLPDATVLVFGGANIQDGAFVGFGTAVEQLFDLPAVLPVLPTPPDTAPPPPPPAQQFFLGPGFNLTGWLWATSVEDATAAIAGQFDSIFPLGCRDANVRRIPGRGPGLLERPRRTRLWRRPLGLRQRSSRRGLGAAALHRGS